MILVAVKELAAVGSPFGIVPAVWQSAADATAANRVGARSYDVGIRDSNAVTRASARGDAERRNYVSTLEGAVSVADLPRGEYTLAVRRDSNQWQLFPLGLQ